MGVIQCEIGQKYLKMESNLTDILTRITHKLNNFTQSPPNHGTPIPNPHGNIHNITTAHSYTTLPVDRDSMNTSVKGMGRETVGYGGLRGQEMRGNVMNQEDGCHGEANNKNKISSYQQFRASRSHEKLANTGAFINMQDHAILNAHQQNYLSLKKRNQMLENDVMRLQDRLKALQEEFGKDQKQMRSSKGKGKELIKAKSSCNESVKDKKKTLVTSMTEKNLKKICIGRHVAPAQNIQKPKPQPTNKSTKAPIQCAKKSQPKPNSFPTSLYRIPFPNQFKPHNNIQLNKISFNPVKTLNRCKSSQTVNQNHSNAEDIKQEKINGRKFGQESSYSINSHASYLKPVDKNQFYLAKQKFIRKKVDKQPKLNKTSHHKINKII